MSSAKCSLITDRNYYYQVVLELDFSETEILQYFWRTDYSVLFWGGPRSFCLLWQISQIYLPLHFLGYHLQHNSFPVTWGDANEKPLPKCHDNGTSVSWCIAQQLLQDLTSTALSQNFVTCLNLILIMTEDLLVPSLFPLRSSVLFHKSFTDFSGAMHIARQSITEPGTVKPAEWSTGWREVAKSRSMAVQHSLAFKQCSFLCFSKDTTDI